LGGHLKVGFINSKSQRDSVFETFPHPAHLRLTQAVETVEKVPFQKLVFEKWDRNIEKRLVFCLANNILAIFEPVVGDFLWEFSKPGFFRQSRWAAVTKRQYKNNGNQRAATL
jgi:hypothetical protein